MIYGKVEREREREREAKTGGEQKYLNQQQNIQADEHKILIDQMLNGRLPDMRRIDCSFLFSSQVCWLYRYRACDWQAPLL